MRRAVGTTRLLRWRADGVMCGIGGYVGPKKDIDAAALLRALAARGPDGEGVHHRAGDGWNGVLAHRRLAVLDPTPASAQPFVAGDHALTFNGEIFNFRALRAELEAAGARFVSQGDTEVVLHGLRLMGPAFLERLRGPFALGLLDGRSGTLTLTRSMSSSRSRAVFIGTTAKASLISHRSTSRAIMPLTVPPSVAVPSR